MLVAAPPGRASLLAVHQPLPPQVAEAVGLGGVWPRAAHPEAQTQCGTGPWWQGGHSLQQVEKPRTGARGDAGG